MKKKTVSLMLVLIMCLSLAACGSSSSSDDDSKSNQNSENSGISESSNNDNSDTDYDTNYDEEIDDSYNALGDSVETDVTRLTVKSAVLGIALNTDYDLVVTDDHPYGEPVNVEDYGLPVEYVAGESYDYLASTGHTFVVVDFSFENLGRGNNMYAIKDMSVIYNGETYLVDVDDIDVFFFGENGEEMDLVWEYAGGSNDDGMWKITVNKNLELDDYVNIGKSESGERTMRVYFDIPVEVDSLSDSFILGVSIKNSSDEYEEFYYSVN